MKKQFILMLGICLLTMGSMYAHNSIEDVVRKFDTAVLNAAIPKAEVAIGFISYADTDTSGSIVPWMQSEIKKAAGKMRRIRIVRSNTFTKQEQTGIATRGASFSKVKKASNSKFIITGSYYKNKNKVELTLELSSTDGKLLASETAIIPFAEVADRHLTLYPDNQGQAKSVKEAVKAASDELKIDSSEAVKTPPVKKDQKNAVHKEQSSSIEITAAMLDNELNLVDILFPGDTVQFMISTDKDAYIAIMGVDANGNQYSLPIKNNILKANIPRKLPDFEVDYQVQSDAFGAEYLLIYAASDPEGLPQAIESGNYKPDNIIKAARGIAAVKQAKKIKTGIFVIPYTVMKREKDF